jgi:hypothetical protein
MEHRCSPLGTNNATADGLRKALNLVKAKSMLDGFSHDEKECRSCCNIGVMSTLVTVSVEVGAGDGPASNHGAFPDPGRRSPVQEVLHHSR